MIEKKEFKGTPVKTDIVRWRVIVFGRCLITFYKMTFTRDDGSTYVNRWANLGEGLGFGIQLPW